jgi:hypothetical protein
MLAGEVNHDDGDVHFIDASIVWVHRTAIAAYDGLYDVNQGAKKQGIHLNFSIRTKSSAFLQRFNRLVLSF